MIARHFIEQGYAVGKVLQAAGVSPSCFYYRPAAAGGHKGNRPSAYTLTRSGLCVANSVLVDDIKSLLQMEFVDYGYLKVTHWLRRRRDYVINPKKVYRLMQQHGLLNPKRRPKLSRRRWVSDWLPQPDQPFACLECDIKYIYIHHLRRNALLLSILDVDSRWLLKWSLAFSIRKQQVVDLFTSILELYPMPLQVWVRNDNGPQFVAFMLREFLAEVGIIQEFTRPATPQQNGHIESYHSIIENVICSRFELHSLAETILLFQRWEQFYNKERLHAGIGYCSPYEYLLSKGIDMDKYLLQTQPNQLKFNHY